MSNDRIDEQTVAVIGAAGLTGQAVVKALGRQGRRVRALIHSEKQKTLLPGLIDFRIVELEDSTALAEALTGVAVAYYIPPTFAAQEEAFGANIIAASLQTSLARLVYHSVLHSSTPAMTHHVRKARVELALRNSSLVWTIVQPAMYIATALGFLNPERNALAPGFSVERLFTPVDVDDLGEAIARILVEEGHDYATYELAGSETLSFTEMAAVMADVAGHAVIARALDPRLLIAQAQQHGFSPAMAEELRLMLTYYDEHGLVGNGRVLGMILGRPATTFREAMKKAGFQDQKVK